MKKAFTFILSGILMVISLTIGTAYAADGKNANVPTPEEIVSELEKYETPYYGENFDFNNDGSVNVFDMIALRKKLVSGEDGITIATAVKLELWLLGKEKTLGIYEYGNTLALPSQYDSDGIRNLTSHDFRFVGAYEGSINRLHGDSIPAVVLCFLGIDEYVLEHRFIYNFCNNRDEFDEFVTEGTGYTIGIKDGLYTLALNTSASKEIEDSTTLEIPVEDVTEEEKINSAFIQYDLTKPNLSTAEVLQTLDEISTSLNAASYSFTINKDSSNIIQLSGKTELSEINIIVYEFAPIRETPIIETDAFYLFYDNAKGFGLLEK